MVYKDILRRRAQKNNQLSLAKKHNVTDVLRRFVYMTEKAQKMLEQDTYIFVVDSTATKNDVKYAIKVLYDIDIVNVRFVTQPLKQRMQRGVVRKKQKKAYIRLPAGTQLSIAS